MLVNSTAWAALQTSVTAGPTIELPTLNPWPIHFILFCQAPEQKQHSFSIAEIS